MRARRDGSQSSAWVAAVEAAQDPWRLAVRKRPQSLGGAADRCADDRDSSSHRLERRARRVYTEQLPKSSLHISERYRVVADRFRLPFDPVTLALVQPVPRLDRAVAVHVDTGQPVRVLPTDMLTGIVDGLQRLGADVRLFGTEHEIVGELQRVTGQRVTHVRPSLRDLPGELARCRVFVGGDSGLLHLACALGIASVGIYGPNVPALSAPRCSHLTVVDAPCDCRPCDQRAPCPSDRACYRQIARDNLHKAIARAFQPGARPAPPFDHR